MAVSGGIKFFELNQINKDVEIVASSGQASATQIFNREKYSYWRSVGSNDTIIERLDLTFPAPVTISRCALLRHNLERYYLYYWDLGMWVNLGIVGGVDSINGQHLSVASAESGYPYNTSYYELITPVTASKFRINMFRTQIPNQEKYLGYLYFGDELGTLEGYPNISAVNVDKNQEVSKMLDGRVSIKKGLEVLRYQIDFQRYPTSFNSDIALMYNLADRDHNFLVWLCGGRVRDKYFKYEIKGFRLEDMLEMQVTKSFKTNYKDNYYRGTVNFQAILEEAV